MNSCSRRLVSPARPLCSSELAGCLPETRRHRQQQQSARALSFSGSDTLCCWESTAACSTAALARPTCSVASSHPASGAWQHPCVFLSSQSPGRVCTLLSHLHVLSLRKCSFACRRACRPPLPERSTPLLSLSWAGITSHVLLRPGSYCAPVLHSGKFATPVWVTRPRRHHSRTTDVWRVQQGPSDGRSLAWATVQREAPSPRSWWSSGMSSGKRSSTNYEGKPFRCTLEVCPLKAQSKPSDSPAPIGFLRSSLRGTCHRVLLSRAFLCCLAPKRWLGSGYVQWVNDTYGSGLCTLSQCTTVATRRE